MKKTVSIILSVVLLLSFMLGFNITAYAEGSGTFGETDNLTWDLNDEGTLTISGTGKTGDCTQGSAPWYSLRDNIKSVVIDSGVTNIGNYLFYSCTNLTSVTIPDSVLTIGSYSFGSCSKLASITIPNSVTAIGSSAFNGCSKLASITIPNSVTAIGSLAFSGCSSLTSVTLPSGLTTIQVSTFARCTKLASVSIPNSVTSIGNSAFNSCTSLTSITLPTSLTSIVDYAFAYSGLTSITIPSCVTTIGTGAFNSCESLTSVTLPKSIATISNYAFNKCSMITSVNYSCCSNSWSKISIGSGNTYLQNANRTYLGVVTDDAVAATCTASGLTEGSHCSVCNTVLVAQTEVPAAAHTWVAADCTTPKTCSACEATEGEALGHTWVVADCTTPKTCSVCEATEGEALGHTWVAADCTTPKTCSVCEATEGEALGHTYVDYVCSTCGDIDPDFIGMAKVDGVWSYVKDGAVDTSYTGVSENSYGKRYIKNGVFDSTKTGLVKMPATSDYYAGKYVYVKAGKVMDSYTGLMKNGSYGYRYVVKGVWDSTKTGLIKMPAGTEYQAGKYVYIKAGKFMDSYTGIMKNGSYGYRYVVKGVWSQTTGLIAMPSGSEYQASKWVYIEAGKFTQKWTGIATNKYGKRYVKNSVFASSYSGKVSYNGKTYTVKNGKVV